MKHSTCLGIALATMLSPMAAYADQDYNAELNARLPQAIRDAGTMIAVNSGSFPPYQFVEGTELTGATADFAAEISDILGVEITHATVAGLPALLSGIGADRYQFAMGPVGDFPSRRDANDFVDWVQEYVVFAVQAGEDDIFLHPEAVEIQSYADQPTSILSVRSNRADAFFSSQAPLTYFVQQSDGSLELAGVGQSNGFPSLVQGAVVPSGSALGPVLRDAFQILMDNGTYMEIMTRWGLENNTIDAPGINMGEAL